MHLNNNFFTHQYIMMNKKQPKQDIITNWAEKIPSKFKDFTKRDKNFKDHLIEPESMVLLVGKTGSGKSNYLLEFLSRKVNSFYDIIIFSGSFVQEPFYNYLKEKIPDVQLIDDINDMPTVDDLKDVKRKERLLIYDDSLHVNAKKMLEIEKVFSCARKKGFTVVFISQSFTAIPIFIRKQASYIVLFKTTDDDAIKMVLRRYHMNYDVDALMDKYKAITATPGPFLTIDLVKMEIRKNFVDKL